MDRRFFGGDVRFRIIGLGVLHHSLHRREFRSSHRKHLHLQGKEQQNPGFERILGGFEDFERFRTPCLYDMNE